jgi:hypothetical protein
MGRKQGFEDGTPLLVGGCAGLGDEIEHDQRAATEIVPAFKRLAVGPDEALGGELRQCCQRGLKTVGSKPQHFLIRLAPTPCADNIVGRHPWRC